MQCYTYRLDTKCSEATRRIPSRKTGVWPERERTCILHMYCMYIAKLHIADIWHEYCELHITELY